MNKKLEFSAWLRLDLEGSLASFKAHLESLDRVNLVWSLVDTQGMPLLPEDRDRSVVNDVVQRAHDAGIKVYGLNSNYTREKQGFDPDRARLFLKDEKIQARHLDRLIEMAKEHGLDGLDLDYESIYAEDRGLFSAFVTLAAKKLHAEKMQLGAAVHAKRSDQGQGPECWHGPQAQDWAAIAPQVDYFQPMCYDFHNSITKAGPVAPPDWSGQVLDYCLQHVSADKIEMGIPAYGLNWQGELGLPVRWQDWQQLEKEHGPAKRDSSQELTLSYQGRQVYYNDSVAWLPKLKQAIDRGVRGIAMWELGAEDPRVWKLLESINEDA